MWHSYAFCVACFSVSTFFQNNLFQKFLSGIFHGIKQFGVESGSNVLSGLILVQNVSKGYQQKRLVGGELSFNQSYLFSLKEYHWNVT